MTYEEVLSNLKTRLMVLPAEKGPHVRAMEIGASYIAGVSFVREDYHASEITTGMMIYAMWVSEPRAASTRDWPTFRIGAYDSIVADGPIGFGDDPDNVRFWGGHCVAVGLPEKLRDFVIAACNAYRDTSIPAHWYNPSLKPAEAEPEPFGWYAGPTADKLSHGPFPTRDEAFAAYRVDHAAEAFVLVEGRPILASLRGFTPSALSTGIVVDAVDQHLAESGATLPKLWAAAEVALSDMLNDAIEAWGKRYGIRPVGGTGVEARTVERVPEVERPNARQPSQTDPVVMAEAAVELAKGVEHSAWATGTDHDMLVAFKARKRAEIDLDYAKSVAGKSTRFEIAADIEIRQGSTVRTGTLSKVDFPPNPPARPHTGDMRAMLDDIGRIELSGLHAAEAQGWDGAAVSSVS